MIDELSISGGGVKGFSFMGALYRLEQKGYLSNLKKIIGVSIGSFFALCLALGYKPSEMLDTFFDYDLRTLKDVDLSSFFTRKSLLKAEKYKQFVLSFIEEKAHGNITLLELYEKTGIEFVGVVCCVNKKNVEYISWKTDPELEAIKLVMMSSAIPGFFPPVKYKNYYYVDGGVLNNIPYKLLSSNGIIICQKSREKSEVEEISNFFDYIGSVMHMVYKNVQPEKKYDNMIEVECGDVKVTSFNITKDEKLTLIRYGIDAVDRFIDQKVLH